MKFSELAEIVKGLTDGAEVLGGTDADICDVCSDSRDVSPDSLFCCIKGENSDGHEYVSAAERSGAAALLCERRVQSALPQIVVPSVRSVMGFASAAVHGNPADRLLMVGVTGTNGKTTTTYIIRSILQAAGIRCGLLGTIIESDGVNEYDADRTTPESCTVQRRLAAMVKNGCGACVMETSSHGLFIGRLDGCRYDVPVFTNLAPEHLDFHNDMENYFLAKRLLFTRYARDGFVGAANADDAYGRRLVEEFPNGLHGFSMSGGEYRAADADVSIDGISLTLESPERPPLRLRSPLAGAFNVWNILCAASAMRGRVSDEAIVRGAASVPQVPGRLERYALPNGAFCFVDFAHTPTALRSLLTTVRALSNGRIISLFGHGGGRYPMNRPELGRAAAELADHVIITMDNPRNEDPAAIASAIEDGVKERGMTDYETIINRRDAIHRGLSMLGAGDVLVVSGKGPEKYLQIGSVKTPYSDAETVRSWIESL